MAETLDYARPSSHSGSAASARAATLALIPAAVAFNFAIATLVRTIKLPIYLDCIGQIVTTLIAGVWPGVAVAGLSQIIGSLTAPDLILYIGTAVAMGLYAHVVGKMSGFKTLKRAVIAGVGMGILSASVSFGITAWRGGITSAGSSFVTLFYLHRGFPLVPATILSGLTCDPIDKITECLVAVWLIRAVPVDLLSKFRGGTLDRNFGVPTATPSSSRDLPWMICGGILGLAAALGVAWRFTPQVSADMPGGVIIVHRIVFCAVGMVLGALAGSAIFSLRQGKSLP